MKFLYWTVGLSLAAAHFPSIAQSTVEIPLKGTLEPRCNARVHDLQVMPGQNLKLVLYIDHSCNAGHTLLIRVSKGEGAELTRTKISYGGKSPNRVTDEEAVFHYSAPVTGTGMLTVEWSNASKKERNALIGSLSVLVLPD